MQRSLVLAMVAAAAVLPACDGGDTEDTDAVTCTVPVTLFPEDGATRAYYRTAIDATFGTLDTIENATISVAGPDGDVTGTSGFEGKRLAFEPGVPLAPGAEYTVTVSYDCAGAPFTDSVSWTVSEVGSPTTLDDLVGNAYALDLSTGEGGARFLEPEGIGAVLGSFLTFEILLGVESVADPDITMFGALGVEGQPGVQEPCTETIDFPVANISENPYFELGPQEFTVTVEGTEVTIDDLYLSGSFAPDGSYIDGAVLAGLVDTRPFKDLVDDNPDAPDSAVCDLALGLGVECIDCPDGTGAYCLNLLVDSIAAAAIDGPLERIDDPCALERCSAEPDCAR